MWKNILLLNDGRTGNCRQAESIAKILTHYLGKLGINSAIDIQEIKYKSKFARSALVVLGGLTGRYLRRCFWCLRLFLEPHIYRSLLSKTPDAIISGGATLASLNVALSGKTGAKSIVVMRPSLISLNRFDLAIIPRHDLPPERKNIVITEGALNLVDRDYLEGQTKELLSSSIIDNPLATLYIGLLVGGDARGFHLPSKAVSAVINEIKSVSKELGADILVSTSRRTPPDIEELVKKEFSNCPSCKLLVIANEKNLPCAVGGILGLSRIVVISPESIMMISEAVNSEKNVLVFDSGLLKKKHRRFLNNLLKKKYINLTPAKAIGKLIRDIALNSQEQRFPLGDDARVEEALSKII